MISTKVKLCCQGISANFAATIPSNGTVYINDRALQEQYLPTGTYTRGGVFLPDGSTYIVSQDSYFVLGDNRNQSSDSRTWGFVSKQDIISKLSFCYWLCNTSK